MSAGGTTEPSIHQLRLFLALSRELHFGAVAARLCITQSALSQQIRDLEKRLGVKLFERTSRSVSLTPDGRAMVPDAERVLDAMVLLRQTADSRQRQVSGRLVVGTIGAEAAMPSTRGVLSVLRDRHPRLAVELVSLSLIDHMSALLRQEVDVLFHRAPVPDGVEAHHLATEPRVACLPVDDPLAAASRLTLARLAGYPVVDMPEQVPRVWWDFWAVDPRPDGSAVRYGPVVPDLEALLHAVASGEAICFLPAAARDFFPRPGVRYVDVTDLSPSASVLAWLAGNRDEPTIRAVRQAARIFTRQAAVPPGGPAERLPSGASHVR
ncbi:MULTISPECIES: LysR family transcriptional regulator [Streptomyces]|uniref:LysR family transcriptional regulator n=1 Tax=Streptomyces sudanensis TaxID=436397 RepID=A0ABY4TEZ2_9ACTN|nr:MULTISPECIES: LysR family transcriptional regulator [Streptomyces]URN17509.1 LysR family transcriptional regulator [Streptomyces sudanensis]